MPGLDRLKPGEKGRVRSVGGSGALRRRLLDMGITPGTLVMVRKAAPLGDPIELFLRGYELSIRKADATNIEVECERDAVEATGTKEEAPSRRPS